MICYFILKIYEALPLLIHRKEQQHSIKDRANIQLHEPCAKCCARCHHISDPHCPNSSVCPWESKPPPGLD